jgi:Sulfotransferase family
VTLPDFLVIGAYKAGTTSLHHYLRGHPQIFVPERKEPSFFAFDRLDDPGREQRLNPLWSAAVRDLRAYEALFSGAVSGQRVGEVSPEYLKNPHAVDRIADRIPHVQLVAVLRDPVERAFSDFLMYRRDGREDTTDFAVALDRQEERRAGGLATGQYVITGFYGRQLAPYYRCFGRDRIRVVLSEDLHDDRAGTLAALFGFLGVEPGVTVAEEREFNRSGVPSNAAVRLAYAARRRVAPVLRGAVPAAVKQRADALLQRGLHRPHMSEETRARLRAVYRDDILALQDLIDRDLSDWLAS